MENDKSLFMQRFIHIFILSWRKNKILLRMATLASSHFMVFYKTPRGQC